MGLFKSAFNKIRQGLAKTSQGFGSVLTGRLGVTPGDGAATRTCTFETGPVNTGFSCACMFRPSCFSPRDPPSQYHIRIRAAVA